MIQTTAGLPNNCSVIGEPITEGYWYADSVDAAIAGLGICEAEYKRRFADAESQESKSELKPKAKRTK